ncbi:hypothetical protein OROGR_012731 [Orobanche gracilis]
MIFGSESSVRFILKPTCPTTLKLVMETASSMLRFCGPANTTAIVNTASTPKLFDHMCISPLCITSSRNSHYYSIRLKIKNRLRLDRIVADASTRNTNELNPSHNFAVFLEVEGVLMDVYRLGNREAFNVAFRKLGLDCANWTEPVYLDLVRKSAADEERMLILYFNRVNWLAYLSCHKREGDFYAKSSSREVFFLLKPYIPIVGQLTVFGQKNALDDLVMSRAFLLRPGVEEFIDNACEEGIRVVILTACGTSGGEKVARSIVEKLGTERMSKTKIIGDDEVKQSFYGQLVFGEGPSSDLDEQLANEGVRKTASVERRRISEEVAPVLKLKLEPNNNSSECLQNIVAALRAGEEYAQVPIYNCVLVAGSQYGVAAAERISMPCVVLRSSSTTRADFPSAVAVMDGFGGDGLTISALGRKLLS